MANHRMFWTAVLAAVVLFSGCDDPDESAYFEADDTSALSECMAEQFPFEPEFLAARSRDGRTGIFLQTPADVKSRSDVAYIQLYDTDAVSTGETIELDVSKSHPDLLARGKMVFLSSCPDELDTLKLDGTIEFESFDPSPQGIIDGNFDGQAVDARDGEVKIDELTGHWRFLVRQGPPHEDFYALPERP